MFSSELILPSAPPKGIVCFKKKNICDSTTSCLSDQRSNKKLILKLKIHHKMNTKVKYKVITMYVSHMKTHFKSTINGK